MAINIARPKGRSIKNLRMVWGFTSRYPWQIAIAAIALSVAATATVSIPWGFKFVIDKGFGVGAGNPHAIAPWFERLLGAVAILAVATAVRYYFVSWLGERTVADIRLAVHRNLLRQSPASSKRTVRRKSHPRITVDTTIIEQVVGTTVSVALRNLVMAIGCVATMFVLAPKLAGLMLLGIPLVLGPILVLGRSVRTISTRNQSRIADVGTVTNEVLGAMKVVQAFNQQHREASRFREAVAPLAHPRRPAGDGQRRPAPRPADQPQRLRRGDGDPRRRRAADRGLHVLAREPARRAPAGARRAGCASSALGDAAGAAAWSAARSLDLAGRGSRRRPLTATALRAMHARKTGALIRAVRGRRRGHGRRAATRWPRGRAPTAASSAWRSRSSTTSSTSKGRRPTLGKTAGKDAAAGKPTYPGALRGRASARRLAASLRRTRRSTTLASAAGPRRTARGRSRAGSYRDAAI